MEAVDTVQGLIYQLEKASQCAIEALGHPIEFHAFLRYREEALADLRFVLEYQFQA